MISLVVLPSAERIVRVSASLEECGLVESGGDDSDELYATMDWFASDPQSAELVDRFASRWGPDCPALGSYAAALYPAVRTAAHLVQTGHLNVDNLTRSLATRPRAQTRIARADGVDLVSC